MSEKIEHNEETTEEFEVVELESEEGEIEEFVIIDRVDIADKPYAIMALLEDMENMEGMSEEEFHEHYGEEDIFFIMRQDGEEFLELTDDEFAAIKDDLDKELEKRGM